MADSFEALLREHEGVRARVYDDATGKPVESGAPVRGNRTTGVGANLEVGLYPDERAYFQKKYGDPEYATTGVLDRQDIDTMFAIRASVAEAGAKRYAGETWDKLNAARQAVLGSMAYNMGTGDLMAFGRLKEALVAGNFERAAAEVLDSDAARNPKLAARYQALAQMMRTGRWPGQTAAPPGLEQVSATVVEQDEPQSPQQDDRPDAELSPYELMKRRMEQRRASGAALVERAKLVKQVQEAAVESPPWYVTAAKETGKAVWGAGVDVVTESFIAIADIARFMVPLDQYILGTERAEAAAEERNAAIRETADVVAPPNETTVGGISRGLLSFVAPDSALSKVVKAEGVMAAMAKGAAIDYSVFDPNQGNLSNLINELAPELRTPVTEFLATDPDDEEALGRLKNVLEGATLGVALEGIFRAARYVIGARKVKAAHEAADKQSTSLEPVKTEAEARAEALKEVEAKAAAEVEAKPAEAPAKPAEAPTEVVVLKERDIASDLRSTIKLSDEARAKFNQALVEGNDMAAGDVLSKDFNFGTFDWAKIQDARDIRAIINTTSEIVAEHIDEVKGGVQSHEQTKRLANLVGVSGEQVHHLFADVRGDKGIAARFHAAQRTLIASAAEIRRLAQAAKAAPADPAAKAAVFRQIELHAALQAEVKGAQTEIARALNGMRILKEEADNGFREFDQLMRSFGSGKRTGASFERFMDDLLDSKSLEDLNAKVRDMGNWERLENVIVEYVVNAMLSSPKTHIINFTSNVLNTFLYTGDRLLGGAVRRVVAGDKAAWREAKLDLVGKFAHLDEAFKLARQAWKDAAPVTDKRQRLEFQTRRAISMDGTGAIATTVNWLGKVVRTPGRLLVTGDEFFKAINRNAEISVLAYREADKLAEARGLKIGTPDYEKFVKSAMRQMADPSASTPIAREIRSKAIEKSRLTTFQEAPRTAGGQRLEAAINANKWVKLIIAPFFRTPMNILRQGVIDRTPLGLILRETREQLINGSSREQAEIIARMTSGVSAMTAFWAWSGTGEDSPVQIIGKVPYDSSEKAAGVLDYSLRIGDKWFQFNRLDPLGMWLGMVADARMHAEHSDDEQASFAVMQGALAGFLNNVTNKTWAKSLADIYDLLEGVTTNEPAAVERAIGKWRGQQLGKFIPQLAKSVGEAALGGDERFAYEAWTTIDNLMSQLPVLNRDVPKRHDALGRPIGWENSALSVINPFAISDNPSSEIDKELARLDFTVRPMPKSLVAGGLDLTAAEYSKLTGLVGSEVGGKTLEQRLEELVTSPTYKALNDAARVYVLKKQIEVARGIARARFLQEPGVIERFRDAKIEPFLALIDQPEE